MILPRRVLVAASATFLLEPGARATPAAMAAALHEFTRGAAVHSGRVTLDVSPLVENGNTVPLSVVVDSPMTEAEHVRAIAVFNERNPQPHVITVQIGPRAGRAQIATHIRLATSQTLLAVAALSDGSFWSASTSVVVTLAACVEG